jgi:cytoskeletal protein CcmA (bactofilin family)
MIRMGRGKDNQPETPTYGSTPTASTPQYQSEAVASPSRAVTDSESMARDIKEGRLSGFVGHGTTLTGETNFHAMLRVDGHLLGTVTSENGTLIVGTNGQVDANVAVSAAMINGSVNGDIVATERIQLGRTAKVIGNIQTPRLIIEDGAVFEGSCSMLKAQEQLEEAAAHAATSYGTAQYATESDDTENLFAETEEEIDDEEVAEAATV